jgi:hypothetical protein
MGAMTTPRVQALEAAVHAAEDTLRLTELRSRQAVERARSELSSLQVQLEREIARDPHPPLTLARSWHVGMK